MLNALQLSCCDFVAESESELIAEEGDGTTSTKTLNMNQRSSTAVTVISGSIDGGSQPCLKSEFTCWSDAICVTLEKHCNGIPDCIDQSDEFACTTRKHFCCFLQIFIYLLAYCVIS